MAVAARTAANLSHTAGAVLAASPGVAANVPDGDTFPNGGNTVLILNNTGGSSYYVDVYVNQTVDNLPATARRFTVPATTMHVIKLGPVSAYGSTVLVKAENVAVKMLALAL